MTPGPLLLLAALGLGAGLVVVGSRSRRLWLALTLASAAVALLAALLALLGGDNWEWRSAFALGGEPLHLRLDGIAAWFLALLAVIGGAGAAYAHEYWSDENYPQSAPRGRRWWSALLLSMGFVLLTSNGLHFLIGWELFTVAAYFLITLDRQKREVRAAGWLYLGASHAGTMALFAFFALLAAHTGSWELGDLRARTDLAPLFWLALAGFGVKAGLFPLHVWLPSAHANAPSHVSAILSGVALKLGLYGLVRVTGWLPVPAAAGWVVLGLGAASALFGVAFALAQNDLKRLLAYCSVENVGIILVGLGLAVLGAAQGDAPWGRLALAGALLHVWNHGLFKALLFFGAGAVLHATGTREISRLGGLWRAMPWTAALFGLGAVAISGLPPLNGFVSEWLIYLGLFETALSHSPSAWAAMPAAILLGLTGALALACFIKAGALVFLGAPRTAAATHAHDGGPWMRGPMLGLAVTCVALGLAPALLWPALTRIVASWQPGATTAATLALAPSPLARLAPVLAGLAVAAVAAALYLWRRIHLQAVPRRLTWDCGYATPTARMQYTGGSFADLAAGWFSAVLRPVRDLRRPRGAFPPRAHWLERFPETVLEHVLTPVSRVILHVSTAVRRLQHGRLQSYLLYLVAGLAALGALVWLGGPP